MGVLNTRARPNRTYGPPYAVAVPLSRYDPGGMHHDTDEPQTAEPHPNTAHATTAGLCLFLTAMLIASVPFTLLGPGFLVVLQVVFAVLFLAVGLYHLRRARAVRASRGKRGKRGEHSAT
jgi:hypothetical protein